jgi:hypothetical protein
MKNSGKNLEGLVAYVEALLLPNGFDVKTNEHVFDEDGIQIAEFDIEIRGKIGSTQIAWLIECRDRPSAGPAPGSWIEQLVGRRTRFGFNKVTAVSTTGFAIGAKDFAANQGIELRVVQSLNPEAFSDWLMARHITQRENRSHLLNAQILLSKDESEINLQAASELMAKSIGTTEILRSISTNLKVSLANAFLGLVSSKDMFNGLIPNGGSKVVNLLITYVNDEDHFVLDTPVGTIRVESIAFNGELSIKEWQVPLVISSEYKNIDSDQLISQTVAYKMQPINGANFDFEIHKLSDTGAMHLVLRNVGNDQ